MFERLGNKEAVQAVWAGAGEGTVHDRAAQAVEGLMRRSLSSGSLDNITGVLLCLPHFDRLPSK